jgi:hypothetical protein
MNDAEHVSQVFMPSRVEAGLSDRNSYVILCPHCNGSRELRADEIPPKMSNPFSFTCSCGETLHVRLVAFRGYRKRVNLIGSFMLVSSTRKLQMLCAVHDISVKGMRVSTDLINQISKDEPIQASIILDDEAGTKLEMPARVARVSQEPHRLTLGVEFMPTSRQEEILASYISR